MAGWEDDQQSHRRFPHRSQGRGKTSHRKGKSGTGFLFQPKNMLGRYTVQSPFFDKLDASAGIDGSNDKYLEIHELVESRTGYLATFNLGAVSGVMLICGSRKALREVVEAQEASDDDASDDSTTDHEDAQDNDIPHIENIANAPEEQLNTIDDFVAPPNLERPSHAFEKNTFRTPKWFAQWRGRFTADGTTVDGMPAACDRDNKAHFEFSSAACHDFKATFTCPYLNATEVAMNGWKVTDKPSHATSSWSDFSS